MISQILEDDLLGRLTSTVSSVLIHDLHPFPILQHKLQLLVHALPKRSMIEKFVASVTTAQFLFPPYEKLKGLSHEIEMNYKWYKSTGPN
jgi:hypothetical protein